MDNLGRPIHIRHMDTASQGPNCFAESRERMMNLVEYQGDDLSLLAEKLALAYPTDGRQNRNAKCFLDLTRRSDRWAA